VCLSRAELYVGFGTSAIPQKPIEPLTINQLHISTRRELPCILGEGPRRHYIPAGRPLRRNDSVQLAHHRDPNLLRPPLLALHQKSLFTKREYQVDPTVGRRTAAFHDLKTSPPKALANDSFEVSPAQAPDICGSVAARAIEQRLRMVPPCKRSHGAG
jgi:hypothetical protein